jgi:hypothetical protein
LEAASAWAGGRKQVEVGAAPLHGQAEGEVGGRLTVKG